ncbi:hypothetical protein AAVH_26797, partial [Aphelenchoides avenae]
DRRATSFAVTSGMRMDLMGRCAGKVAKKPWAARAQTAHAGSAKNGALRANGFGRRFGGPSPRF